MISAVSTQLYIKDHTKMSGCKNVHLKARKYQNEGFTLDWPHSIKVFSYMVSLPGFFQRTPTTSGGTDRQYTGILAKL